MYAIIETGGKQLRVEPGRFYDIERLAVEEDEKVSITKVLFVQNEDDFHIGQPFVEGATVEGTVLRHLRGRKIIVYKMKPKKKTRKKRGHRQELTRLMIDSITLDGAPLFSQQRETEAESIAVEPEVEPVEAPVEMTETPPADAIAVEPEVEPVEAPVEMTETPPAESIAVEPEVEPVEAPVEMTETPPADAIAEASELTESTEPTNGDAPETEVPVAEAEG